MQSLAVNGYTRQEVINALHSKTAPRVISFRYDLLDKNEVFKKALTTVASCTISHSALADIKRTAKIKIRDDGDVDFLSDRVQSFTNYGCRTAALLSGVRVSSYCPLRKSTKKTVKHTGYRCL